MDNEPEIEKQIEKAREDFDTGEPVEPFEVKLSESAPPAPVTAKPPKVKKPKKL